MNKVNILLIILFLIISSCSNDDGKSDAYGNFEATEIIVSAEATGKLLEFNVEEGQTIDEGEIIGYIDTVQLHLKKLQLEQQKKAVKTKSNNVFSQVTVLQQEKNNTAIEKERNEHLVNEKVTRKKHQEVIR